MFYDFIKLKNQLLNLGNDHLLSKAHRTLGRILNIVLFMLIVSGIFSLIGEIYLGHFYGSIISGAMILFIAFISLIKFNGNLWLSSFLFNVIFPFAIFCLGIIYDKVNFLSFYFSAFTISGLLYSQKNWMKYIFVIYNGLLLSGIAWFRYNHGTILGDFHPFSNISVFVNVVIFYLILIFEIVNKLINAGSEIDELNRQLEEQNDSLNHQKKELMRLVSHDLKSPLKTVGSFVKLIDKKVKEEGRKDIEQYSRLVTAGVQKMETLINDTLQFTLNHENSRLEKVEINLDELLDEIISDLKSEYPNATMSIAPLPILTGSRTLFKKIFQNILHNGLKYNTSASKHIDLSFNTTRDNLCFQISDNGIGIEKKHLSSIFEKYNRGKHNDSTFEGTGLGLAIVQQIVHSLEGEIKVASELDEGTTFTISLPIALRISK